MNKQFETDIRAMLIREGFLGFDRIGDAMGALLCVGSDWMSRWDLEGDDMALVSAWRYARGVR